MIRTVDQAHGAIADMVWWLKGFAAARPASIDEGSGEHRQLEGKLDQVRTWLRRVEQGVCRRIGDEEAFVLTYAEAERLADAFTAMARAERHATDDDRMQIVVGRQTLRAAFDAYQREAREARLGDDLPF